MKEYKMRRGETLADRIPEMKTTIESYFGSITDTESYNGSDLYVVDEPDNPVFQRIIAGDVSYNSKKDTLAVDFVERDPSELDPDDLAAASDAVDAKNTFLKEATGRDAKSRRESMKRAVEDDAPDY
ncbi:DUF5611 family protein [Haloquadratum walsbyi]|jgi:hypothetical protein|uniref:DUF5611 domain-containing protein n=1 Tax=Haloquadratum walsbyi J07HQW2 TaxID=1238425 RepID=U1NFA3_9EURY|nr:DUF5611 family protein [Haloquadratum walsbyi]ERG95468.1 MAG: hypothetical protein J07HQW2_01925 [Haloquadratum walsbyi J07HQW2]